MHFHFLCESRGIFNYTQSQLKHLINDIKLKLAASKHRKFDTLQNLLVFSFSYSYRESEEKRWQKHKDN